MRQKLIFIILLLCYPRLLLGAENLNFGTISFEDEGRFYGNPMIVIDANGKGNFHKTLEGFKVGFDYQGFDSEGRNVSITLLSKNTNPEGDLYEKLFESKPLKSKNLPVLFWSSKNLKPTIIQTQEVHLDKSKIKLFEDKIRTLVSEASSGMRDPYSLSKILKPSILSLKDESSIVTLFFPLIVTKKDANNKPYEDERGSAFFLYDSKQDKVIIGKFGHPEWSPEAKNVNVIKPVFFFNMNNTQYCFCQYDDAWEHNGFALIELRSGKVSMISY